MQSVLFFSDKQVRDRLFARVDGARGLVLVAGVRHGEGQRAPEAREPFASLERLAGGVLTQVLVVDEGTVDGMWRDPLGDLADRLYPNNRDDAYAASSGYLILQDGRPRAVVRKRGVPDEDLWFLQEALSRLTSRVPAPDPSTRPGQRRAEPAPRAEPRYASEAPGDDTRPPPSEPASSRSRRGRSAGPTSRETRGGAGGQRWREHDADATPPRGTRVPPREPAPPPKPDPWTVLGIARDTPLDEARKAYRTLITQYHPDKVAHLAPEFHALAERRTREILDAWAEVEKALSG